MLCSLGSDYCMDSSKSLTFFFLYTYFSVGTVICNLQHLLQSVFSNSMANFPILTFLALHSDLDSYFPDSVKTSFKRVTVRSYVCLSQSRCGNFLF